MKKGFIICFTVCLLTQTGFGQGFNINPTVGIREFNPGNVNRSVYDPINDIVYVTGTYDAATTPPDFDPDPGNIVTLPAYGPAGTVDVFLAKYSSNGVLFGVIGFGGDGNDIPITIDYDASGNVYLGGTFNSTSIDLDPDTPVQSLPNSGGFDGFGVVFDQFGNYLQSKAASSTGGDAIRGVKIDQFGDIIIAGNINGSMFYERYAGDITLSPSISFEIPGANCRELLVDSNDDIIVAGVFSGTVDFDPNGGIGYTSAGMNDIFIVRYDGFDGSLLSVRTFGGPDNELVRRVALGQSDEVYFSGNFETTFDADPGPGTTSLAPLGLQNFFVSKFNSDETLAWSKAFGGDAINLNSLVVNDFGDLYMVGLFDGNVDFDPGPATFSILSTNLDGFLLKLTPDGSFGQAIGLGNDGYDEIDATVLIDNAVTISFAYFATQNADLDPNCAVVTLGEYNYGWLGYQDVGIVGEPATQPSNLTFPVATVTATTITGSFTSAATGPSGYLVLMSAGQSPDIDPVDGMDYCLNDQLGLNGAGEIIYAIASGSINGFTTVNHAPGEQIFYKVFSYNGSGSATNYNTTSPLTGSATTLTPAPIPTMQASNLQFTPGDFEVAITWTRGDGANILVVMREGSPVDESPALGQTYTSSDVFGTPAAELGFANYVVYNGSGTSVTVTGLTHSTNYHVQAFEYNGVGGMKNYMTATTTGNPASFDTTNPYDAEPTVQASSLQFSAITNTTANFSWTRGNGTDLIVIVKAGSSVDQVPQDGMTYMAPNVFGSGTDLGGGNFVAYKGFGTNVTVTGLSPDTNYFVQAFEYNGNLGTENYLTATAGNNPNGFMTTNICPGVTSGPALSNILVPSSVDRGDSFEVSLDVVSSGCPITGVKLVYGETDQLQDSDPSWIELPMTNTAGDTYTTTIGGDKTSGIGITLNFEAYNQIDTTYSNLEYAVPINIPEGSYVIPYNSFGSLETNYRIISIPLTGPLFDKSIGSIFDELGDYDNTKWRMFSYNGTTTSELNANSELIIGQGYWLIAKDNPGESITVGGGTTAKTSLYEPFTIQLRGGWNLIGNPYPFDISMTDIQAANTGQTTITPQLKVYTGTGSYENGAELEKFSGGFVFSSAPTPLYIPAYRNPSIQGGRKSNSANSTRSKNPIDQPNWEVLISTINGDIENTFGGVGMNNEASEDLDRFDELSLPRFLKYGEIVHDNPAKFGSYYSKDIVPSTDNYVWEFTVESNEESEVVELNWENDYFGNNSKQLFLWDSKLQRAIDMRASNQYAFNRSISKSFMVIYGEQEFIKEEIRVNRIVLHGISPNPASTQVNVAFSVPDSSTINQVNFELIDLMGRQIWSSKRSFNGGYHEMDWEINRQVLSGMYILKVQSGQSSDHQRLIIRK